MNERLILPVVIFALLASFAPVSAQTQPQLPKYAMDTVGHPGAPDSVYPSTLYETGMDGQGHFLYDGYGATPSKPQEVKTTVAVGQIMYYQNAYYYSGIYKVGFPDGEVSPFYLGPADSLNSFDADGLTLQMPKLPSGTYPTELLIVYAATNIPTGKATNYEITVIDSTGKSVTVRVGLVDWTASISEYTSDNMVPAFVMTTIATANGTYTQQVALWAFRIKASALGLKDIYEIEFPPLSQFTGDSNSHIYIYAITANNYYDVINQRPIVVQVPQPYDIIWEEGVPYWDETPYSPKVTANVDVAPYNDTTQGDFLFARLPYSTYTQYEEYPDSTVFWGYDHVPPMDPNYPWPVIDPKSPSVVPSDQNPTAYFPMGQLVYSYHGNDVVPVYLLNACGDNAWLVQGPSVIYVPPSWTVKTVYMALMAVVPSGQTTATIKVTIGSQTFTYTLPNWKLTSSELYLVTQLTGQNQWPFWWFQGYLPASAAQTAGTVTPATDAKVVIWLIKAELPTPQSVDQIMIDPGNAVVWLFDVTVQTVSGTGYNWYILFPTPTSDVQQGRYYYMQINPRDTPVTVPLPSFLRVWKGKDVPTDAAITVATVETKMYLQYPTSNYWGHNFYDEYCWYTPPYEYWGHLVGYGDYQLVMFFGPSSPLYATVNNPSYSYAYKIPNTMTAYTPYGFNNGVSYDQYYCTQTLYIHVDITAPEFNGTYLYPGGAKLVFNAYSDSNYSNFLGSGSVTLFQQGENLGDKRFVVMLTDDILKNVVFNLNISQYYYLPELEVTPNIMATVMISMHPAQPYIDTNSFPWDYHDHYDGPGDTNEVQLLPGGGYPSYHYNPTFAQFVKQEYNVPSDQLKNLYINYGELYWTWMGTSTTLQDALVNGDIVPFYVICMKMFWLVHDYAMPYVIVVPPQLVPNTDEMMIVLNPYTSTNFSTQREERFRLIIMDSEGNYVVEDVILPWDATTAYSQGYVSPDVRPIIVGMIDNNVATWAILIRKPSSLKDIAAVILTPVLLDGSLGGADYADDLGRATVIAVSVRSNGQWYTVLWPIDTPQGEQYPYVMVPMNPTQPYGIPASMVQALWIPYMRSSDLVSVTVMVDRNTGNFDSRYDWNKDIWLTTQFAVVGPPNEYAVISYEYPITESKWFLDRDWAFVCLGYLDSTVIPGTSPVFYGWDQLTETGVWTEEAQLQASGGSPIDWVFGFFHFKHLNQAVGPELSSLPDYVHVRYGFLVYPNYAAVGIVKVAYDPNYYFTMALRRYEAGWAGLTGDLFMTVNAFDENVDLGGGYHLNDSLWPAEAKDREIWVTWTNTAQIEGLQSFTEVPFLLIDSQPSVSSYDTEGNAAWVEWSRYQYVPASNLAQYDSSAQYDPTYTSVRTDFVIPPALRSQVTDVYVLVALVSWDENTGVNVVLEDGSGQEYEVNFKVPDATMGNSLDNLSNWSNLVSHMSNDCRPVLSLKDSQGHTFVVWAVHVAKPSNLADVSAVTLLDPEGLWAAFWSYYDELRWWWGWSSVSVDGTLQSIPGNPGTSRSIWVLAITVRTSDGKWYAILGPDRYVELSPYDLPWVPTSRSNTLDTVTTWGQRAFDVVGEPGLYHTDVGSINGFDGYGYVFYDGVWPAKTSSVVETVNGVPFLIPPADGPNAILVDGATIVLPKPGEDVWVVYAAACYWSGTNPYTPTQLVVEDSTGKKVTVTVDLADWCASGSVPGNVRVIQMDERAGPNGLQTITCGLWAFELKASDLGLKDIAAISFPNPGDNRYIWVFSVTVDGTPYPATELGLYYLGSEAFTTSTADVVELTYAKEMAATRHFLNLEGFSYDMLPFLPASGNAPPVTSGVTVTETGVTSQLYSGTPAVPHVNTLTLNFSGLASQYSSLPDVFHYRPWATFQPEYANGAFLWAESASTTAEWIMNIDIIGDSTWQADVEHWYLDKAYWPASGSITTNSFGIPYKVIWSWFGTSTDLRTENIEKAPTPDLVPFYLISDTYKNSGFAWSNWGVTVEGVPYDLPGVYIEIPQDLWYNVQDVYVLFLGYELPSQVAQVDAYVEYLVNGQPEWQEATYEVTRVDLQDITQAEALLSTDIQPDQGRECRPVLWMHRVFESPGQEVNANVLLWAVRIPKPAGAQAVTAVMVRVPSSSGILAVMAVTVKTTDGKWYAVYGPSYPQDLAGVTDATQVVSEFLENPSAFGPIRYENIPYDRPTTHWVPSYRSSDLVTVTVWRANNWQPMAYDRYITRVQTFAPEGGYATVQDEIWYAAWAYLEEVDEPLITGVKYFLDAQRVLFDYILAGYANPTTSVVATVYQYSNPTAEVGQSSIGTLYRYDQYYLTFYGYQTTFEPLSVWEVPVPEVPWDEMWPVFTTFEVWKTEFVVDKRWEVFDGDLTGLSGVVSNLSDYLFKYLIEFTLEPEANDLVVDLALSDLLIKGWFSFTYDIIGSQDDWAYITGFNPQYTPGIPNTPNWPSFNPGYMVDARYWPGAWNWLWVWYDSSTEFWNPAFGHSVGYLLRPSNVTNAALAAGPAWLYLQNGTILLVPQSVQPDLAKIGVLLMTVGDENVEIDVAYSDGTVKRFTYTVPTWNTPDWYDYVTNYVKPALWIPDTFGPTNWTNTIHLVDNMNNVYVYWVYTNEFSYWNNPVYIWSVVVPTGPNVVAVRFKLINPSQTSYLWVFAVTFVTQKQETLQNQGDYYTFLNHETTPFWLLADVGLGWDNYPTTEEQALQSFLSAIWGSTTVTVYEQVPLDDQKFDPNTGDIQVTLDPAETEPDFLQNSSDTLATQLLPIPVKKNAGDSISMWTNPNEPDTVYFAVFTTSRAYVGGWIVDTAPAVLGSDFSLYIDTVNAPAYGYFFVTPGMLEAVRELTYETTPSALFNTVRNYTLDPLTDIAFGLLSVLEGSPTAYDEGVKYTFGFWKWVSGTGADKIPQTFEQWLSDQVIRTLASEASSVSSSQNDQEELIRMIYYLLDYDYYLYYLPELECQFPAEGASVLLQTTPSMLVKFQPYELLGLSDRLQAIARVFGYISQNGVSALFQIDQYTGQPYIADVADFLYGSNISTQTPGALALVSAPFAETDMWYCIEIDGNEQPAIVRIKMTQEPTDYDYIKDLITYVRNTMVAIITAYQNGLSTLVSNYVNINDVYALESIQNAILSMIGQVPPPPQYNVPPALKEFLLNLQNAIQYIYDIDKNQVPKLIDIPTSLKVEASITNRYEVTIYILSQYDQELYQYLLQNGWIVVDSGTTNGVQWYTLFDQNTYNEVMNLISQLSTEISNLQSAADKWYSDVTSSATVSNYGTVYQSELVPDYQTVTSDVQTVLSTLQQIQSLVPTGGVFTNPVNVQAIAASTTLFDTDIIGDTYPTSVSPNILYFGVEQSGSAGTGSFPYDAAYGHFNWGLWEANLPGIATVPFLMRPAGSPSSTFPNAFLASNKLITLPQPADAVALLYLAALPAQTEQVKVLLQFSDGTQQTVTVTISDWGYRSNNADTGTFDFNGDGVPDLWYVNDDVVQMSARVEWVNGQLQVVNQTSDLWALAFRSLNPNVKITAVEIETNYPVWVVALSEGDLNLQPTGHWVWSWYVVVNPTDPISTIDQLLHSDPINEIFNYAYTVLDEIFTSPAYQPTVYTSPPSSPPSTVDSESEYAQYYLDVALYWWNQYTGG